MFGTLMMQNCCARLLFSFKPCHVTDNVFWIITHAQLCNHHQCLSVFAQLSVLSFFCLLPDITLTRAFVTLPPSSREWCSAT